MGHKISTSDPIDLDLSVRCCFWSILSVFALFCFWIGRRDGHHNVKLMTIYPAVACWVYKENKAFPISDTIITSGSKYVVHEYYINDYSLKSILTIRDFTLADFGKYFCICKNDMSPIAGVKGAITVRLKEGMFRSRIFIIIDSTKHYVAEAK